MILTLEQLLTSFSIVYVLLAVLLIEAGILLLFWKLNATGIPPFQILTFLGAGAAFTLALGSVLLDAAPIWLAVCLSLAFVFQILDLKQRWQRNT